MCCRYLLGSNGQSRLLDMYISLGMSACFLRETPVVQPHEIRIRSKMPLQVSWTTSYSKPCKLAATQFLPLVECLPPVVTKNFGQTFQHEGGEEGFRRWGPSSALAFQSGERSPSEPPETPLWAVHAVTERQARKVLGISHWPDVESMHQVKTKPSV